MRYLIVLFNQDNFPWLYLSTVNSYKIIDHSNWKTYDRDYMLLDTELITDKSKVTKIDIMERILYRKEFILNKLQ